MESAVYFVLENIIGAILAFSVGRTFRNGQAQALETKTRIAQKFILAWVFYACLVYIGGALGEAIHSSEATQTGIFKFLIPIILTALASRKL